MKDITLKSAYDVWGVTKIDSSQHDQIIDSLRVIVQHKFHQILSDIKANNYIIGLSQYDLAADEVYAIHMMLINNENVILQEENGYAKYTWASDVVKSGLGIRALGLYCLTDPIVRLLYKKYKMRDPKLFNDVCFILNVLIGYAYQNKSSLSLENKFNLYQLARQLFMPMDRFLVALTFLRKNNIVKFQRVNTDFNFKFMFCDVIANDIESQLAMTKIAAEDNIIRENSIIEEHSLSAEDYLTNEDLINNDFKTNEEIKVNKSFKINKETSIKNYALTENLSSEEKLIIDKIIQHLQKNTNKYVSLPTLDDANFTEKAKIKNLISHHECVIFQPSNFNCEKKIQYTFQYVEAEKKKQNFADYCIFRFISQRVVKILFHLWNKYDIKDDLINTLWLLDHFQRKANTLNYTRFNMMAFRALGINYSHYNQYVSSLIILKEFKLIDAQIITSGVKHFSFQVKLINMEQYLSLNNDQLLQTLENNYLTNKTFNKQDDISTNTNQSLNIEKSEDKDKDEDQNQNENEDQNEKNVNLLLSSPSPLFSNINSDLLNSDSLNKDLIIQMNHQEEQFKNEFEDKNDESQSKSQSQVQENNKAQVNDKIKQENIQELIKEAILKAKPFSNPNQNQTIKDSSQNASLKNASLENDSIQNDFSQDASLRNSSIENDFVKNNTISTSSMNEESKKLVQALEDEKINILMKEKEQLIIDNTQLLIKLSQYKKLQNIDQIKNNISNDVSITLNDVLKEIGIIMQQRNVTSILNCQKQLVKLLTNLEQKILMEF